VSAYLRVAPCASAWPPSLDSAARPRPHIIQLGQKTETHNRCEILKYHNGTIILHRARVRFPRLPFRLSPPETARPARASSAPQTYTAPLQVVLGLQALDGDLDHLDRLDRVVAHGLDLGDGLESGLGLGSGSGLG
jgi:hypothetical protein